MSENIIFLSYNSSEIIKYAYGIKRVLFKGDQNRSESSHNIKLAINDRISENSTPIMESKSENFFHIFFKKKFFFSKRFHETKNSTLICFQANITS